MACFKPLLLGEHVFMGDNHPHSGCHGGCTGNLGVHGIAEMASERIMSALNYPVHHSGCVGMKRSLLPKLSRNRSKRKNWPLGRFFYVSRDFPDLGSPFSLKEISDFG
jgi:hypothetical protein